VRRGIFRRFLIFNAFCGFGVVVAVLLLNLVHSAQCNGNVLAIILVTCWNFGMNAHYDWASELSLHDRR
jgi:putative flippase GtrA